MSIEGFNADKIPELHKNKKVEIFPRQSTDLLHVYDIKASGKDVGEFRTNQEHGIVGFRWKSSLDFSEVDQEIGGVPVGKVLQMEEAVSDISRIVTGRRFVFDNPNGFQSKVILEKVGEKEKKIYELNDRLDYHDYYEEIQNLSDSPSMKSIVYGVKDNQNNKFFVCKIKNPALVPSSASNVDLSVPMAQGWSENLFEWVLRNHADKDAFRRDGLRGRDVSVAMYETLKKR